MEKIIKSAALKEVNDDGLVTVIVTNSTTDRDNEIVNAEGVNLTNYNKHPVLLSSHNYSKLTNQIGKAVKKQFKDGNLEMTFEYFIGQGNFEADWGYYLAQKGIASYSIGFIPIKSHEPDEDEKQVRRIYDKVELLEVSQVLVPSNPDALQNHYDDYLMAIKSFTEPEINEEEVLKPYPNEHSCRLNSPSKYDKFRRKKCAVKSDGKCIDFIFGIKEGKSELQAMRYNVDIWTEAAAKAHCKDKEGTFEPAKPKKEGITLTTVPFEVNIKEIVEEVAEEFIKSGRVISAKNRTKIKEVIAALEELLELSEPDKSLLGDGNKVQELIKSINDKSKF